MGWCHEFGCQIKPGCDHPMQAGESACTCSECGVVCNGQFAACPDVWARGPIEVELPVKPRPGSPQPQNSPASAGREDPADALAWLRKEFATLNARFRDLSSAVTRQDASLTELTGAVARQRGSLTDLMRSQASELNSTTELVRTQASELNESLAEVEGCAAELRNEAGRLRDLREAMTEAVPQMVDAAARHAVASTADELRAELRRELDELTRSVPATIDTAVRSLPPVVDAAVRQASVAAMAGAREVIAQAATQISELARVAGEAKPSEEVVQQSQRPLDEDLVQHLQKVVHETVVLAVGESIASLPVPANPVDGDSERAPEAEAEPPPAAPDADVVSPGDEAPVSPALRGRSGPAPEATDDPAAVSDEADAGDGADTPSEQPVPAGGTGPSVSCSLDGLEVGPSFAVGISDALVQARVRRRRRRPARPPAPGLYRHDPFAGQIAGQLERFALARRQLAFAGDSAMVAIGEKDGCEVAVALDVGDGGLSLVGPGAGDVGRAIALTFLAGAPPARANVVVVGDLLPGPDVPGLTRAQTLAAALDRLEAEVAQRSRAPSDAAAAMLAPPVPTPAMPALLIATTELPASHEERLRAIREQAGGLGLAMLFVDVALAGSTTLQLQDGAVVRDVAPTGRTDELSEARLFTIGPEPATELLGVLATARTDEEITLNGEVGDEPFRVEAPASEVPIHVTVLGSYRIDVEGKEIRSGLRAKARELLAFYLIHPEGATLDAATEALWPEADPGRGSEWFWTALGNLRSLLRSASGRRQLKVIERSGDLYRVEPVFDVDLWRFQAALGRAGGTVNDTWTAAIGEAAELYRGELVAGADWAWVEVPRDDLRRRAVDVLVSLAATRQVSGEVQGALDALQRAVEVDPLSEQLYRRIMRLHAKLARPQEVAATFQQLQARLSEMGLEPTSESSQLCAELCSPA